MTEIEEIDDLISTKEKLMVWSSRRFLMTTFQQPILLFIYLFIKIYWRAISSKLLPSALFTSLKLKPHHAHHERPSGWISAHDVICSECSKSRAWSDQRTWHATEHIDHQSVLLRWHKPAGVDKSKHIALLSAISQTTLVINLRPGRRQCPQRPIHQSHGQLYCLSPRTSALSPCNYVFTSRCETWLRQHDVENILVLTDTGFYSYIKSFICLGQNEKTNKCNLTFRWSINHLFVSTFCETQLFHIND